MWCWCRVLLTKESGVQGHPAWAYKKKDKEGTGTEDLSLVLSTCIRQLKPPVNQSLKDPNPLTSTATYTNVASFTHKIFLIFLMVGLPIPNSMVFNSLYLVVLKWFLMFFFCRIDHSLYSHFISFHICHTDRITYRSDRNRSENKYSWLFMSLYGRATECRHITQ